jgi:hypothetical protein
MDLDSVADNREQPNPESVAIGECMYILFFISHPGILSFGTFPQMVVCVVLMLYFLGLINHIMKYITSKCVYHTFLAWVADRTYRRSRRPLPRRLV